MNGWETNNWKSNSLAKKLAKIKKLKKKNATQRWWWKKKAIWKNSRYLYWKNKIPKVYNQFALGKQQFKNALKFIPFYQ